MRAAVCFAAMIPARRAACSGSPFLIAPCLISRTASRDIVIEPRAIASLIVTGFSPTSTIVTRPCASTWDRVGRVGRVGPVGSAPPDPPDLPDRPDLLLFPIALRQEKG